ncbi:hypothetical protein DFH94DRAFT_706587 [Russula ochroleuca]|uniref:Uncharacterized protein n=1 Tax=Russula ochroleuca TaxID=152965 RepID=A0A9P5N671_9AGAM|nr:hypothetical protein DFH94DRAFT_706587 [Russula ochroleuca]
MLAERGKDATAQDEDRETPLHPVLQEGQVEVASRHIGHGTDVRAENNDGEIPLHPVLQEGQVDVTCQWKPSWNCVCT